MFALVVKEVQSRASLAGLRMSRIPLPVSEDRPLSATECLVRVVAASINASDVKNSLGMMPHTQRPVTLGRDFSGVVVQAGASCKQLIDKPVMGSGGELGFLRDGAHAQYMRCEAQALCPKPEKLSFEQAACVGVTFSTAYLALVTIGHMSANDTVLITGASGGVGSAAVQLARHYGARIIAVDRTRPKSNDQSIKDPRFQHIYLSDLPDGFASLPAAVRDLDWFADQPDDSHSVNSLLDEDGCFRVTGKGPSLVLDVLGGDITQHLLQCCAVNGSVVNIATSAQGTIPVNLFQLYRHQASLKGANSLFLNMVDTATILKKLAPLFESGALTVAQPGEVLPVTEDAPVGEAYLRVINGSRGRVVLSITPETNAKI